MIEGFPKLPDRLAMAMVGLSAFIMAYSHLFSLVPILVFYMLWLSRVFYQKRFILRLEWDLVLPALFAVYCLFTLFWSDYRGITIYKGAEFASMIVCMVIIARIVSVEAFVKGVAIGGTLICLSTLLSNVYTTPHGGGGRALIGLMGSKNQVGFFAAVSVLAGAALFLNKGCWRKKLAQCAPPIAFGAVCLVLSHSAAALVALVIALGVVAFFVVLSKMPRGLRPVAFGIAVFGALVTLFGLHAFEIDLYAEILKALGKSPTLKGRTVLWEEGLRLALERPILGHGYQAFWVVGQADAERFWEMFHIDNKTGFHFHNLFIQAFVELGVLGTLILLMMIVGVFLKLIRVMLTQGIRTEAVFVVGLFTLLFVRSFAEVGALGPFGMGTFLFFYLVFYQPSHAVLPYKNDAVE
jgi:exopolysaccharide production protein ExoQ